MYPMNFCIYVVNLNEYDMQEKIEIIDSLKKVFRKTLMRKEEELRVLDNSCLESKYPSYFLYQERL